MWKVDVKVKTRQGIQEVEICQTFIGETKGAAEDCAADFLELLRKDGYVFYGTTITTTNMSNGQ